MVSGRIIKGVGGLYTVDTEETLYQGKARGIFRKDNIKPCIGDFVEINILDEDTKECAIEKILPCKNKLIRPSVSNIDQVFIVFSAKSPDPNLDLLDRFIIMAEDVDMEVIIIINKIDLVTKNDLKKIYDIYSSIGYNLFFVSTYDNSGIDNIKNLLHNKVSVFAGPSGVGKSSIINLIMPNANMETGELSKKIQRGKHTTRHVELLKINNGYLVDSPGFTSLFLESLEKEELQYLFKEFLPFIENCKYNNCTHIKENVCGIKAEVGKSINEVRYKRYVSFYNEILNRR